MISSEEIMLGELNREAREKVQKSPIHHLIQPFLTTNHIDVAMSALRSTASEAKRPNVPWS
jgi:hypothetical protein